MSWYLTAIVFSKYRLTNAIYQSDKSCFSRVGVNYQYDWEVTFRDAQRLQLFRQRLRRSLLVLDSTLAIGEGLQAHYLELKGDLGSRIEAFGKLQAHLAELKIHKRSIEDLLLQTGDISNLVSKFPEKFQYLGKFH